MKIILQKSIKQSIIGCLLFVTFAAGTFTANAQCIVTLEDFETNRKITYGQMDGTFIQNAANPGINTVNGSSTCGKYVRKASVLYNNLIGIGPIGNGDEYKAGKKVFKLDVYSPAANTNITLVVSNNKIANTQPYPAGRHSVYNVVTTKANQWETVTFVYATSPDATIPGDSTDQINIQFDPNAFTGSTFYFDNFLFNYPVFANAGSNQTVCSNVSTAIPLNGNVGGGATGGIWSSPTGGVFSPSATNLNATYQLTAKDTANGSVVLALTATGASCGTINSQTTITLNSKCSGLLVSLPAVKFCGGDIFTLNYTATSGTFNSGNLFIAQLSSSTGSFTSFSNIGNMSTTAAIGQIKCTIPSNPTVGNKYRIRIIATSPSTVGTDNGADISLHYFQYATVLINGSSSAAITTIGTPVTASNITANVVSCAWNFGSGATYTTPTSCTDQKVSYSTTGQKEVKMVATDVNGCASLPTSNFVNVYSCNPVVPSNATVITGSSNGIQAGSISIWVKQGASYNNVGGGGSQTIYVSSGGSLNTASGGSGGNIIYLEPFASYDGGTNSLSNVVIYDPNAGISGSGFTLVPCSSLTINSGTVTELAQTTLSNQEVRIYPNPSNGGRFTIEANEEIVEIIFINSLGQKESFSGNGQIETKLKGLLIANIKTTNQSFVKKINVLE